jgi:hypothetical protein
LRRARARARPALSAHFNVQSWLTYSPIQVNYFPISFINADME